MDPRGRVWQSGVVVRCTDTGVRVRFEPLAHCQRCLRGEGCGAGVFSRLFAGRRAELDVVTSARLKSGQAVRIGITSWALVRLAAAVYGLPVVVFILAAVAAATLVPPGGLQDLLALCSGTLGASGAVFYVVRQRSGLLNPRLELLSASAVRSPVETGHE